MKRWWALTMACAVSWGCPSRCGDAASGQGVPLARLRDPAVRQRGEQLYRTDCVLCHGERADGKGVRTIGFDKPPGNFADPLWKTPQGALRAYQGITAGVPGTAMPSWKVLEADDRWALVAYLMSVSERGPLPAPR